MQQRVLMAVRNRSRDMDLMLKREVFVLAGFIREAGYNLDVVIVGDQPLTGTNERLEPDIAFDDVVMSTYAGIVVPCMADRPDASLSEPLVGLLERALALPIPIAAMRGSVRELARAGGLANGRRYSFAGPVDTDIHSDFREGIFEGTGVTADDGVVTAGICPLAAKALDQADATEAFAATFINALAA